MADAGNGEEFRNSFSAGEAVGVVSYCDRVCTRGPPPFCQPQGFLGQSVGIRVVIGIAERAALHGHWILRGFSHAPQTLPANHIPARPAGGHHFT